MRAELLSNWAGNVAFSATACEAPRSVDELRDVIESAESARAIGRGHSFSEIADTEGVLVSTRHLDAFEITADNAVRIGAGVTYGDLVRRLSTDRRTVANLASLPHISVGGAVATATHGSGWLNPSLASAVRSLEIVTARGDLLQLDRGDPRFSGAVVGLGALGVVSSLVLETVDDFEICQLVFEDVPWEEAERSLDDLLSLGYSTSLFLSWAGSAVEQLWIKSTDRLPSAVPGRPAAAPRHPIPGGDPAQCTEQLGKPGLAGERLPHFRFDGVPSAGKELQSEWSVDRRRAGEVFRALRRLGGEIAASLYISEIRAVAADDFWLSPFFERDAVTFHFTWRQTPTTLGAIALVEDALRPFDPRPHWGKLSNMAPDELRAAYPRLDDFRRLRRELDPEGKFANPWSMRLGLV